MVVKEPYTKHLPDLLALTPFKTFSFSKTGAPALQGTVHFTDSILPPTHQRTYFIIGRQDSNLQPFDPKSNALPVSYVPILDYYMA